MITADQQNDACYNSLVSEVANVVESSSRRLTSRDVIRRVSTKPHLNRTARRAINKLVADGRLRYVNEGGVDFLEKNYVGRLRISENVWVLPPDIASGKEKSSKIEVLIAPGIAFGDCRHPTTRLSIRAIDQVFSGGYLKKLPENAVDIGTGSGILAITAALFGVRQITAIDVDACARSEARQNIRANGLEKRICVTKEPFEAINKKASLILANLRLPTLKAYSRQIGETIEAGGAAVFSGINENEIEYLKDAYAKEFKCVWCESEKNWAAVILVKK